MNGISVIKKCLDALAKDGPDLSYIRGMLETFVEMNVTEVKPPTVYVSNDPPSTPKAQVTTKVDEQLTPEQEAALRAYTNGPLGKVA